MVETENQVERVGMILDIDDEIKIIRFLGYGTFQGCFIPDDDVKNDLAELCYLYNIVNPKIMLDSGEIVWGCECWWDSEEFIKNKIDGLIKEGYLLVEQSITKHREDFENFKNKC